ncbi:multicopper oxidase domain-containing protein [Kibdelosporangium aridum]|uniref:multicopper oxidase domain-containing protein n=1 Tax=Kibdelosporangium aridum TaxID=2030 RepID=UPI0035E59038
MERDDAGSLVPRRSVLLGAGVATGALLVAGSDVSPSVAAASGGTKRITLYAERLPGDLIGYGLAPGKASVPGPTIELTEGQKAEVTLMNTTDQTISLYAHGVDFDMASDGTPLNNGTVAPGQQRTYTWRTHAPYRRRDGSWDGGSAGYWHYHDHAMGTQFGTDGIAKGLYGALVVRRRGDLRPDKQFVVVMNNGSLNNTYWPNSPTYEARLGERVEWIAIGHGFQVHTFHLHGHRWSDTRTGYATNPSTPVIDTKTLLPGVSYGFQVRAGEHVGPGAWMYHCHVQLHADAGMVGLFLVKNADGSMPPGMEKHVEHMKTMSVTPMPGMPSSMGHGH